MTKSSQPRSILELRAAEQACTLDQFKYPIYTPSGGRILTGQSVLMIDTFTTQLDQDFALDSPLFGALLPAMATHDIEQTALLMMLSNPPKRALTQSESENYFNKLFKSYVDSIIGTPNLPGNVMSGIEASLRAIWKREAANGFQKLRAGTQGTIRLGKHIKIYSLNISATGELRKNAKIWVRTEKLPTSVVHTLATPFTPKSNGKVGAIRMGASDLKKMDIAANAIADARWQSNKILRGASTKWGGGALAFAPTAVLDFYDSTQWSNGSMQVDWTKFKVSQAKNQTGNLVGFAAGAATAATAVGLGAVAAVGWPVVVVGLIGGITAQAVWGSFDMDKKVEELAKAHIR